MVFLDYSVVGADAVSMAPAFGQGVVPLLLLSVIVVVVTKVCRYVVTVL